jgi:hypothetical protein
MQGLGGSTWLGGLRGRSRAASGRSSSVTGPPPSAWSLGWPLQETPQRARTDDALVVADEGRQLALVRTGEVRLLPRSLFHPEVELDLRIEVEAAVSSHSVFYTIVAGQVVAGGEMCGGRRKAQDLGCVLGAGAFQRPRGCILASEPRGCFSGYDQIRAVSAHLKQRQFDRCRALVSRGGRPPPRSLPEARREPDRARRGPHARLRLG